MKNKSLIIALIVVCLLAVGCAKKKVVKNGDWVISLSETNDFLDEDAKDAIANYNKELKPVALLGEQVVAGTNYMYLVCDSNSYKVVVIYKDLEGKMQVTKISDFDVTKYANENKSMNVETLVGGWTVNIPGKPMMLEGAVQAAFDEANGKIVGVTYYPIKVLATQEKDGTNYAILCYGKMSDANGTTGIYVETLYMTGNTNEVVSISSVDLKDFNQ